MSHLSATSGNGGQSRRDANVSTVRCHGASPGPPDSQNSGSLSSSCAVRRAREQLDQLYGCLKRPHDRGALVPILQRGRLQLLQGRSDSVSNARVRDEGGVVRPSLRSRDAQVGGVVEPDADGFGCPLGVGEPVPSVRRVGVAPIQDNTAAREMSVSERARLPDSSWLTRFQVSESRAWRAWQTETFLSLWQLVSYAYFM